MTGWIKLHRSMLEWQWYGDQNVKAVFIHCLLMANTEDKIWKDIEVKRGQFVTSHSKLSEQLKLSVKAIRISLTKLKRSHELSTKVASKYSIITVCNYDIYQSQIYDEGQGKGQAKGKQRASKGQQLKNNKNKENEKNDNTPIVVLSIPAWAENFKSYNPELIYPFEENDFAAAWDAFIEHRKEIKKPITDRGQQAALKKLGRESNNDLETAMLMIEQSIANGWQGLFELKEKNNGKSTNYSKFGVFAQYKERCDFWEQYGEGLKGH